MGIFCSLPNALDGMSAFECNPENLISSSSALWRRSGSLLRRVFNVCCAGWSSSGDWLRGNQGRVHDSRSLMLIGHSDVSRSSAYWLSKPHGVTKQILWVLSSVNSSWRHLDASLESFLIFLSLSACYIFSLPFH